ncbi:P-loop ATPase, Sll1717 family, partial [Actinokineospora sp.]|uniref:P-loop ATPase, Sll1717 family n=1 Tax=Actinokineospora sp. TaxID=1872133 RepID=UPI003D6C4C4C
MDQQTDLVDGLSRILTPRQPFGPSNTEAMAHFGPELTDRLFDRTNVIYTQAVANEHPTYIIGRKGSGKTAFLGGSLKGRSPGHEILRTENVYHEMLKVLHNYTRTHGRLFVDQSADIWTAVLDQVAIFHAWHTAEPSDERRDMQILTDYVHRDDATPADSTHAAEQLLRELHRRVTASSVDGLRDLITGISCNGVTFERARQAMLDVLQHRDRPVIIVMDNLEDLHLRLHELTEVLTGLFRCTGRVVARNADNRPYGLQICLPSELYDKVHEIAAAPDKDLQGKYLKIYWTAPELLRLTGARLGLLLMARHPERLEPLRAAAARREEADPDIALLRAALPERMHSELRIEEDPLAYMLRHTQLLPRHLIEILNSVFSRHDSGSVPWAVTPQAVMAGTRYAERLLVSGILNAYQASYPDAAAALRKLA